MACAERVRGELAAFRPSGRRAIWSPPASERVLAAPRLVAGGVWGPGRPLGLGPGSGWELRCCEPHPAASPAAAPALTALLGLLMLLLRARETWEGGVLTALTQIFARRD